MKFSWISFRVAWPKVLITGTVLSIIKERHLYSQKTFMVLLKTMKTTKVYPSESSHVHGTYSIDDHALMTIHTCGIFKNHGHLFWEHMS